MSTPLQWKSLAVSAICLVAAACSSSPYLPRFLAARKAESEGRLDLAADNYDTVFRTAKRKKDRTEAGMRLAALYLRMGKAKRAVETYLAVETGPGRGTFQGARALFRAGRILADRIHDLGRAEALWRRVVGDYPDSLAAADALSRLLTRYKARYGPRRVVDFLVRLAQSTESSQLRHYAAWQAAQVCRKDLRDHACALKYCVVAWKTAPRSALADDAMICAARQARALGRPRLALVWYRRLLSTRKQAWFVGSYHSEWLDDAQFEVGKLYLDDLGQPKRAIEAFRIVVRSYPSSLLRDDAFWWICLTKLRQGRRTGALKCWNHLVRRFPKSRFVREKKAFIDWAPVASALRSARADLVCPALATHARSHPFGWFRRRRRRLAARFKCPRVH